MQFTPPYVRNAKKNEDYLSYRNATGQIQEGELPIYESWTCDQWVAFYKRLKGRYTKDQAKTVWMAYWNNKQVSVFNALKVCSGQLAFRNYFLKEGIDFPENLYSVKAKLPGFTNKVTTYLIIGGVIVGVGIASFVIYNIWSGLTMQRNIRRATVRAADNLANRPDLVAEGVTRGMKGGL